MTALENLMEAACREQNLVGSVDELKAAAIAYAQSVLPTIEGATELGQFKAMLVRAEERFTETDYSTNEVGIMIEHGAVGTFYFKAGALDFVNVKP